MGKMRRLGILAALLLSAAPAMAADTITIGVVGSGSAVIWPLFIAEQQGYFAKNSVAIDLVTAPSSVAVQQQVAAGSVDIGSGGLVDPIRAIDKGAHMAIVRIEARAIPYVLYAKPAITTYAGLKGKTLMVGGAKDITRFYLERMTAPNGLKATDYDLIYAGATSARYAALQSGAVDAALLTAPFNFKADAAGFKNLGQTGDYVKDMPFTGYAASLPWAKAHKKALSGFLMAYSDGITWLQAPENRAAAIALLVRKTAAQPDDAAKTYDYFKMLHMYDPDGRIDDAGLGKLIAVMKERGDIEGGTDLGRFVDASLLGRD